MPGVRRLVKRIAPEFESHRSPEPDRDPLPRLERVSAAEASLDVADRRATQPDEVSQLALGQPAPFPARTDLAARARELLPVPQSRLERQGVALDLRHAECMVIRALAGRLPPVQAGRRTWRAAPVHESGSKP